MSIFSKEQLEKLALYTAGINAILADALLASSSPEQEDEKRDVEVEIFIVEKGKETKPQK